MNKFIRWFNEPVVIDQGVHFLYRAITYTLFAIVMVRMATWVIG